MTKPTDDCPFDFDEEEEADARVVKPAAPRPFPPLLMPLLSTPYHKHLDLDPNNEATMQVVADFSFNAKRLDFIKGRIEGCDVALRRRNIRGTFASQGVDDRSSLLTFHCDDFSRDGNPYSCWKLFFCIRTGHYDIVVDDRIFDKGYATSDLFLGAGGKQEPNGRAFVSGTIPSEGGGAAKMLGKRFEFISQAGNGRGGRMQLIRPLSGSYRYAKSGELDHFTESLHNLVSPYANLKANRVIVPPAAGQAIPAATLRPEEMRPDGTRFVGRM